MRLIDGGQFDEERSFYGEKHLTVRNISIDGPKDGESAFKECENIEVGSSFFNLRYPFWHNNGVSITDSTMTSNCRAAIWYSQNVEIYNSKLLGIKAVRESNNIILRDNHIVSPEFGWRSNCFSITNTSIESEYLLFEAKEIKAKHLSMKGKYSFQYVENGYFENCQFDTKDAFWHSKNVMLKNCYVKGEYLGWFAENLVLDNCTIEGTQPLCYCKNLKLINCTMIKTDLSFERSVVQADIKGNIESIKNPLEGSKIIVSSVGQIIKDIPSATGEIIIK